MTQSICQCFRDSHRYLEIRPVTLSEAKGLARRRERFFAVDDRDLDAIDALVEVGIRSTRSDAASWLIHAGIDAHENIFESVYATVAEIRLLRTKAQAIVQQVTKAGPSASPKPGEPSSTDEGD